MKKAASAFVMLTIAIVILVSFSSSVKIVGADASYSVDHINHRIEVLYNGFIFINDTITITGEAPDGLLIGFPYIYGPHVLRCFAYNASDVFPVDLSVPLQDRLGFYAVKVNFPRGTPQLFTVGFVLSNDLLTQNATDYYTFGFPAYPSLTTSVAICNVSIIVPEGAGYVSGTVPAFNYGKENLTAFDYSPANLTFIIAGGKIQDVDIEELRREMQVNEFGDIRVSDTYYIKNEAQKNLDSFDASLLPNASNPTAQDQFGRKLSGLFDGTTNHYKITLTLETGKSLSFTVKYDLPRGVYVKPQDDNNNFLLNMSAFQNINYYVGQASVAVILPEGAKISSFGNCSITRNVFQEIASANRQGVLSLDNVNLQIVYTYSPLWLAFRPTLWIWTLAIVGCVVAIVWKRPRAPATVAVPSVAMRLSTESIRSFVDAYEEKQKITSEIESLEAKVRKGRIPRRRYKVQRRTLEMRLSSLTRNLEGLKGSLRAAGGRYTDLMRQLEIAENEINDVEVNLKSIEVRHGRGELSLEAYRKLLTDYRSRKEKAEGTINGILLRLREEIR